MTDPDRNRDLYALTDELVHLEGLFLLESRQRLSADADELAGYAALVEAMRRSIARVQDLRAALDP